MKLQDLYNEARATFYRDLADVIRNNPSKSYQTLAVEYACSLPTVQKAARMAGLTRKRGAKAKPKATPKEKRQARMAKGQCAVHGLYLHAYEQLPTDEPGCPTGLWCPRRDCNLLYRHVNKNDRLPSYPVKLFVADAE